MKTIHYPYKIRFCLVTIVPMAPFTSKSKSSLQNNANKQNDKTSNNKYSHYIAIKAQRLQTK